MREATKEKEQVDVTGIGQPQLTRTQLMPAKSIIEIADSLALGLIQCTENAAIAASTHSGCGNKEAADEAASNAIRSRFHSIECRAVVRIGEGKKDNAPGIFVGERLGSWRDRAVEAAVAIDPIDGTTLVAKGLPGAISVIALGICDLAGASALMPCIPSHYMEKLAVGPAVSDAGYAIELDAPLDHTVLQVARALGKQTGQLVAAVLDRPRHREIIRSFRRLGCRVRLLPDGDVAAAIAPSLPESGIDIYAGIGGSPEAVLSSAAVKCMGGQQACRMWPRDADERSELMNIHGCEENDLREVWTHESMAPGDQILFAATGISDSPLLLGVNSAHSHLITHSLLLTNHGRLRRIEAWHRTPHPLQPLKFE